MTAPIYLVLGDSISDPAVGGGAWADAVCAARGATRANNSPADYYRAAVSGTPLQPLWFHRPDLSANVSFWPRVWSKTFTHLFVFLGANDYYYACDGNPHGLSLASWQAAWGVFWQQYRCYGPAAPPVTVLGLTNLAALPDAPPPFTAAQMDAITARQAAANGATFVPLSGLPIEMVDATHVHPTAAGQQWIAGEVLAALGVV